MPRDPRLRRRNGLLIPGGLLTIYSGLGLLYLAGWRDPLYCGEGHRFLVDGTCYSGLGPLALLLIIGVVLLSYAFFMMRSQPEVAEDLLYWGSGAHFLLWLAASLVVLPFLGGLVVKATETPGSPYVVDLGGPTIQLWFMLLLVGALSLVLFLVPALVLFLRHNAMVRDFMDATIRVEYPGEVGDAPPEEWQAPATAAAPIEAVAPAPPESAPSAAPPPPPPQPYAAPPCAAVRMNGQPCGDPVPPGNTFCSRHSCQATTSMGRPCKNPAIDGRRYCRTHAA